MILRTLLALLLLSPVCSAQDIERQAINSGGDEYRSNGIDISYSIGEVFVETENIPTLTIHQGFQQSNEVITGIELGSDAISTKIYPNPTSGKLRIEFLENIATDQIALAFIDLSGTMVREEQFPFEKTIETDISDLSAGTYFVRIKIGYETLLFKLIKL